MAENAGQIEAVQVDIKKVHELFEQIRQDCKMSSPGARQARRLCGKGLAIDDPDQIVDLTQQILVKLSGWRDIDGMRLKYELRLSIGSDPYARVNSRKQREERAVEFWDEIDVEEARRLLRILLEYDERESENLMLGKAEVKIALSLSDDQLAELHQCVLSIMKFFVAAQGKKVKDAKIELKKMFGLMPKTKQKTLN